MSIGESAGDSRTPEVRSLVTGGGGFLGSHLCEYLLAQGHYVVCMDNLITGDSANIDRLLSHSRFTFINQDVTEYIYFNDSLDYVFHLASPASPVDYQRLPLQTLRVGSEGTRQALALAKAKGARFLLASTSEVYGDPEVNPQPETYWGRVNPVGPRAVYDEAKRYAEAMTMAYHRHHHQDVRIVRIFNTYGPRMRIEDGRAIPAFISQALRGEPLTVFGEGNQTRSFCFVSDLIEGVYKLMMSDYVGPVNIGNPRESTILELAEAILRITGSKSPLVHRPLPQDDPKVRCPDITLARRVLGWEPEVSLEAGLAETVAWFRKKLGT